MAVIRLVCLLMVIASNAAMAKLLTQPFSKQLREYLSSRIGDIPSDDLLVMGYELCAKSPDHLFFFRNEDPTRCARITATWNRLHSAPPVFVDEQPMKLDRSILQKEESVVMRASRL